jgi:Transposase zinc-binding domain
LRQSRRRGCAGTSPGVAARQCRHSCRNRHCPKCQGAAAREWLEEREAELLPAPYFHAVYTLPGPIADIAYQNAVIYDILFKASAETMITCLSFY